MFWILLAFLLIHWFIKDLFLTKKKRRKTMRPMIKDLRNLHDLIHHIEGEDDGGNHPATQQFSTPAVNVNEDKKRYEIEVAAPGMNKDDFNIKVDNDMLSISSEKKSEKEEKGDDKKVVRKEFMYSSFERSFRLPENVDQEKIEAKYKDGVLKIDIPKKEEEKTENNRKIEIS